MAVVFTESNCTASEPCARVGRATAHAAQTIFGTMTMSITDWRSAPLSICSKYVARLASALERTAGILSEQRLHHCHERRGNAKTKREKDFSHGQLRCDGTAGLALVLCWLDCARLSLAAMSA